MLSVSEMFVFAADKKEMDKRSLAIMKVCILYTFLFVSICVGSYLYEVLLIHSVSYALIDMEILKLH